MKCPLILLALIPCVFHSQAQKIQYDPVTNQLRPGIFAPFKNGDSPKVRYHIDNAMIERDYQVIIGGIAAKWLKKATLLKSILNDVNNPEYLRYQAYCRDVLGLNLNTYKTQLDAFIHQLQDKKNHYPNPLPRLDYFPSLVPDFNTFKTNYGTLYIFHPLVLDDTSSAVSYNSPSTVYLELRREDFEKTILSDWYKNTINPALAGVTSDNLQDWITDLAKKTGNMTKPVLGILTDTTKKYAAPCDPLKWAFSKADLYKNELENLIKSAPLYKSTQDQKNFFQKWLWTSPGAVRFNPFDFTTPEKFVAIPDPALTANTALFDTLAAAKLTCDLCTASLDTIEYLIKQQKSGGKRFGLETDLKTQTDNNKSLYERFLSAYIALYAWEYPYQKSTDRTTYLQSYDAARHFNRTDRLNTKTDIFRNKADVFNQWTANTNIPAKPNAAVLVYNIPAASEVKITAEAKDTVIQARATTEIGGLAGQIATIATSLNPVTSIIKSITNALQPRQSFIPLVIPPYRIIPAGGEVLDDIETSTGFLKSQHGLIGGYAFSGADTLVSPSPPSSTFMRRYSNAVSYTTIHILDTAFLVTPQCKTCGKDGKYSDSLVRAITSFLVRRAGVLCGNALIAKFTREYKNKCCVSDDVHEMECCIGKLLADFNNALNAAIQKTDSVREAKVDSIRKWYDQSIVQTLLGMTGLQALPDELTLNDQSVKSNIFSYARLKYMPPLDPVKSSARINYVVLAKSKTDTSFTGYFSKSKRKWYMLGAGFVGTLGNLPVSKATSPNPVAFNVDNSPWRFVAGIHLYPAGMLITDNRFIWHRAYGENPLRRLSLFLGVGIPKPLENFYSGIGADLVPGLRLHTGTRLAYYTKYQVVNNQLAGQKSALTYGGWYVGITLEPAALAGVLNIF